MLTVKCGREEFKLDQSDVIMDNGACIQIVTKLTGGYPNRSCPIIAKAKWKQIVKQGLVKLVKEEIRYETMKIKYYRVVS
jgi:hypothetical protein